MLFWKQKAKGASIEAPKTPRGGVGRRCPPPHLERGPPQKHFSFWSSKSLVLLHFECYFCKFVYDGWVALGRSFWLNCPGKTEKTRKILTAVAVFNVSPYKSTVLFLISSFNPPLLLQRPTPIPIFIRTDCYFLAYLLKLECYGELVSNSSSKKWAVRGTPGPITSSAFITHCRLYEHRTRTWYSSGPDTTSQLTTEIISASELSVAITC